MLVFTAYTPHPLIAVPDIGKEHLSKIRGTMKSFREISQELYAAKVDTIIIISPHALPVEGAITINQRPELRIAFTSFGNLSDMIPVTNDIGLGYSIKESVETALPIVLIENEELDYGTSIPLFHILRGIASDGMRIVSLGTCASLDLQKHYDLGVAINRKINTTTKRIAVFASGDLSHGATKHAPGGSIPAAVPFNNLIRDILERQPMKALLTIPLEKYQGISECCLRPLAMLAGILDERQYHSRILSFETALGVGYLTAQLQES